MNTQDFLRLMEKDNEEIEFSAEFAARAVWELLNQFHADELEIAYPFYTEQFMRAFRLELAKHYGGKQYREYR